MMRRKIFLEIALLLGAAIVAGGLFAGHPAQAQAPTSMPPNAPAGSPRPDLRTYLHTPMPPGPYASWPAESRAPALASLRFQCAFIAGMAFAGPQTPHLPPEQFRDVMHAVVSTCVVTAMPDDWPQRAAELEQARSYLEKTKGLLPASMDPEAIGKTIAAAVKRGAQQAK